MARPLAFVFVLLSLVAIGVPADAQNFIENSSETINKGNFKIGAFPTVLMGRDGGSDQLGRQLPAGLRRDRQLRPGGQGGFFNGFTLLGGDAEVWLLKGDIDLAVSAGAHKALMDNAPNSTAIDLSGQLSGHVTRRLEIYGATSVSFESLDGVPDSGFTRAYLVPGIEYWITDNLDFVSEFGVGLNDNSPHYFGLGFAYYIR